MYIVIDDTKRGAIMSGIIIQDVSTKLVVATDILLWRTFENSCSQKYDMKM